MTGDSPGITVVFTEALRIGASVATPIGAIGFVATLVLFLYYRRQKSQERQLQALPLEQRARSVDMFLSRYNLDIANLTREQKFELLCREMDKSSSKTKLLVITSAAVFVICFLIATLAYAKGQRLPPPRKPVVVLMDSAFPRQVYDEETRNNGGTNADDISDVLKDLPVILVKETTSLAWRREEQVLQQDPALVIMHLSCFYEETNLVDSDRRFVSFVQTLSKTNCKFLVYTRGVRDDAPELSQRRWDELMKTVEDPALQGRMDLLVVGWDRGDTFRNIVKARELKAKVKEILQLQ